MCQIMSEESYCKKEVVNVSVVDRECKNSFYADQRVFCKGMLCFLCTNNIRQTEIITVVHVTIGF